MQVKKYFAPPWNVVMGPPLWKWVFCNWACNSIFELQWPLVTHCISTPMSVIRQVAWIARDAILCIYYLTLMQLMQLTCNNSFSTTMELPYNYNHIAMLTSFFIHSSNFNTWHYEDFMMNGFLKYWYPSSIMIIHFRWS
jgi:hypothetical protein